MNSKTVKLVSLIGILFGIVTIISGGSVLMGSNPGYIVFLPLVIFNTVMGFVYLFTGIVVWRNFSRAKAISGIVFLLNLVMLITIGGLYLYGLDIATKSLGAMSFRTLVWLVIYVFLLREVNKKSSEIHSKR